MSCLMRASFFVVMLISIPARANFLGGDDFNDNSVDPAKWGPDNTFQATISEQNGRVEFQSPASNADIAHRPWRLNFGSYNSNWSVLVDYSNTALASNGNRDVVGLQVYNSAMNGDSIAFHSLRSLNQLCQSCYGDDIRLLIGSRIFNWVAAVGFRRRDESNHSQLRRRQQQRTKLGHVFVVRH